MARAGGYPTSPYRKSEYKVSKAHTPKPPDPSASDCTIFQKMTDYYYTVYAFDGRLFHLNGDMISRDQSLPINFDLAAWWGPHTTLSPPLA